jgi:hypothetical protein
MERRGNPTCLWSSSPGPVPVSLSGLLELARPRSWQCVLGSVGSRPRTSSVSPLGPWVRCSGLRLGICVPPVSSVRCAWFWETSTSGPELPPSPDRSVSPPRCPCLHSDDISLPPLGLGRLSSCGDPFVSVVVWLSGSRALGAFRVNRGSPDSKRGASRVDLDSGSRVPMHPIP